jgi:myo-inositol-1-phosphate synthase
MLVNEFTVDSPNVVYSEEHITSRYTYQTTQLAQGADGKWAVKPTAQAFEFRTARKVPKVERGSS